LHDGNTRPLQLFRMAANPFVGDWTIRYRWIVESALKNRCRPFVIDGQAGVLGVDVSPSSNALHWASTTTKCPCTRSTAEPAIMSDTFISNIFAWLQQVHADNSLPATAFKLAFSTSGREGSVELRHASNVFCYCKPDRLT
jgi:hypothetical protein